MSIGRQTLLILGFELQLKLFHIIFRFSGLGIVFTLRDGGPGALLLVCRIRLLQLSKQHREITRITHSTFFTLQPSAHPQRRRVTSDHRFIFFLLSPTLALRGDLCCLRLPTHIRELLCDFGACCSSSTMNNDFEQYFHHLVSMLICYYVSVWSVCGTPFGCKC